MARFYHPSRNVKQELRRRLGDVRGGFEIATRSIRGEVAAVVAECADSGTAVPVVDYADEKTWPRI